ncbi:hypothetical protein JTB14_005881 [Gonioctena quinquepunctata]|nr:hypothetical protein JTB14_005881 [Gonioctena quinquepunctata]
MPFESEYMKETDKKDDKTCGCGDDTGHIHSLHNADNPEYRIICLWSIELTEARHMVPLITKRQLEEQHQRNKNQETITSVQQPERELSVVISETDMDIERIT